MDSGSAQKEEEQSTFTVLDPNLKTYEDNATIGLRSLRAPISPELAARLYNAIDYEGLPFMVGSDRIVYTGQREKFFDSAIGLEAAVEDHCPDVPYVLGFSEILPLVDGFTEEYRRLKRLTARGYVEADSIELTQKGYEKLAAERAAGNFASGIAGYVGLQRAVGKFESLLDRFGINKANLKMRKVVKQAAAITTAGGIALGFGIAGGLAEDTNGAQDSDSREHAEDVIYNQCAVPNYEVGKIYPFNITFYDNGNSNDHLFQNGSREFHIQTGCENGNAGDPDYGWINFSVFESYVPNFREALYAIESCPDVRPLKRGEYGSYDCYFDQPTGPFNFTAKLVKKWMNIYPPPYDPNIPSLRDRQTLDFEIIGLIDFLPQPEEDKVPHQSNFIEYAKYALAAGAGLTVGGLILWQVTRKKNR